MKLASRLLTTTLLLVSLALAGAANAVPISFRLDSISIVGGSFPTEQTYSPGLPLVGSGNIDFGLGTGTVSLPDHSIFIDVNLDGDDAQLDLTGWTQTI